MQANSSPLRKELVRLIPGKDSVIRRTGMAAYLAVLLAWILTISTAHATPYFQAAGTQSSGTGSITVNWPTHTTGDIALLFVESTGGQPVTLSTPSGFVQVANSPQATGTGTSGTQLTVFWARATSSAMPSVVVADPGDHVYARILTYRGVIGTGNPWDVTGGGVKATASTSVTVTGVTTTTANTLIVQAVARDNDSSAAAFSAETNASLSGLVERSDSGTTSGNGGGIGIWDGSFAAVGATGNTTATVTSSINAFLTIALKGGTAITSSPASCVDDGSTGTITWANPGNAYASDNVYATASNVIRNTTTHYLNCTGFNFSAIPAGSVVNGITVFVERKTSGGTIRDRFVYLIKGGVISTAYNGATTTNYTTADVVQAHGGSANLWGTTWTLAQVQASNFGVAFAAYNTSTTSTTNRTVSVDQIYATVDYTPATGPDHIRIVQHGGACSGSSSPASISLIACANAACTSNYTTTDVTGINMSPTSAGYTWSPVNPQTIPAASGGTVNINLARSTAGTATLAITGTPSPAPTNPYECYNTNTGVIGDCNLVFSGSAFSLNVNDHNSDTRQVVTLTSCKGSFAGVTRSVGFYTNYLNPATGTKQGKIVSGTGNSDCATGYSAVGTSLATATWLNLTFGSGTTPQATFSLCYPDAGKVQLNAHYVGSTATGDAGTTLDGSDGFIAAPHHFSLSNIKCGNGSTYTGCIVASPYANPGAGNAAGAAFMKAGNPFSMTVTAYNTNGAVTPNFGRESPAPEGVSLTPAASMPDAPAPITGSLSGVFGSFSNGAATGTAFSYSEAGIITVSAKLSSGNYLSSTLAGGLKEVTTPSSGNIGRFVPDHFGVTQATPDSRSDLCLGGVLVADGVTPCSPTFTYMGEQLQANFTLIAQDVAGGTTQNYDGAYAKLNPLASNSTLNLAAVDTGTSLTARLDTSMVAAGGSGGFISGSADLAVPISIARCSAATCPANSNPNREDGPYSSLDIGIAPVDSDGVATVYDLDTTGDAIPDHTQVNNVPQAVRFGRLKIANTYGSELLQMPVAVTAQYWDGSGYQSNVDDSLTQFDTNLSTSGGNVQAVIAQGPLALGNIAIVAPGAITVNSGMCSVTLAAPYVAGSVDLSIVSAPVYLLPSTTGRVAFGVFKGNRIFIYQRENY